MRKKLLSVLTALALCLSLLPTAVFAEGSSTGHSDHCVCGQTDCTGTGHDAAQAWTGTATLPTKEGYYYLTNDVTISKVWKPKSGTVLCLNGHTITRINTKADASDTDNAAIWVKSGATFTLTDCTEAGTVTHGTDSNEETFVGSGVAVTGTNTDTGEISTFILYGGNISGNCLTGDNHHGGGVRNGGTFIMYGGKISGNTATGGGGGVYNYGAFTMYGGEISGNTAAQGAGVRVDGNANFTMYGGSIKNNAATSNGGGVQNRGTVKLSGCEISGNKVTDGGTGDNGDVCVQSKATLELGKVVKVGTVDLGSNAKLRVTGKDVKVEWLNVAGCNDAVDCKLTKGTFGRITADAVNPISSLLDDGYAFRTIDNDPTWYDQYVNSSETDIQNVWVHKKWITGVTLTADKEIYTFGETVKLTASVDRSSDDTAGIYYKWYKDNDEEPFATTMNDEKHPNEAPNLCNYSSLSAGTHTIYVKVTTHAYTRTSDAITVTVKEQKDLTVNMDGWTYGETAKTLSYTPAAADGTAVTVEYQVKGADDSTYTATVPTNAGDYTVKVSYETTTEIYVGTADFTIGKATVTVTALDKSAEVYDDAPDLSAPVAGTDYTITGLVEGETLPDGITINLSCDADMRIAGEYAIVPAVTGTAANYTFQCVNGTLTVSSRFSIGDVFAIMGVLGGSGSSSPLDDFTDLDKDAWYAEAVEYCLEEGLMSGTGNGKFSPNGGMTRAMVWTVLGRLSGETFNGTGANWYADAQKWAVRTGVSDGTNPNGQITREELVTMLWRFAGSPKADVSALRWYNDGASVSDWAREAMAWAVNCSLVEGSNWNLTPNAVATRCQVAAIFMRYHKN